MNTTTCNPRALALTVLLAGIGLSGCGGAMNFPDAVSSQQVKGPALSGSVYGGHAPIVGSHIYVLQPGTTGYGSQAISMLGNGGQTSTSNGYAITENGSQAKPDPGVPSTAKFVTSDATGSFGLAGGYTCTVGQPVYLYSYGGATPVTQGATTTKDTYSSVTSNISQIVVSNVPANPGANATATYTFTVSQATAYSVGETVTIASPNGYAFDGSQTILTKNLTNTTFSFVGSDPNGQNPNGTYNTTQDQITVTGEAVTGTVPATNPISQMLTVGICPSSGNFTTPGNGAISFVYMNEVSTVATAYTVQPFTLAQNNSAWDIGTSGTTEALTGISNAALTAGQLYSIQGQTGTSTTNDGEGHIANFRTQAGGFENSGNGVVPQATLDTLANILAACIDSTPGAGGVLSTQCTTLFNTATDNGKTVASGDTAPTDTSMAAINIARYPAGNYSAGTGSVDTNYVKDLFGIPTGVVPYAPNLNTAPNDWTIAINYPFTAVAGNSATNPNFELAESLEVDNVGQIWVTAQNGTSGPNISRMTNLGIPNIAGGQQTFGYIPGYVSVDPNNNAWTGNANSTSPIYEAGSNGVFTAQYGSGFNKAYVVLTDKNGNVFTFANTTNTSGRYDMFEYPAGSTTSTTPIDVNISGAIKAGSNVGHGAVDSAGNLWITSENSYQIAYITPTGTPIFPSITTPQQPEFPAIDASGNAWIAIQETNSEIYLVTPSGNPTVLTSATTGANLTATFGAAIDGKGNAWFVNRDGTYGAQTGGPGTNSIIEINPSNLKAISPPQNFIPQAQYGTNAGNTTLSNILYGSLNLAIDSSGNIWITNYSGNSVAEVVGAAAPVTTPFSYAAGQGKLGQKP